MAVQKLVCKAGVDFATAVCDDSVIAALLPLCEGELTVSKSSGLIGTQGVAPVIYNKKRITASKKIGRAYKSNSFTIPHVKLTVTGSGIRTAGLGKLKADLQATVNATDIKMSYDNKGVA